MSGGGTESTSTSDSYSGSGQKWATPYARTGVKSVQSVFDQNQPALQNLTNIANQQVVPGLLNTFNASNQTAGKANQYNSDVLSGKYMNGNPYVASILKQLNEGVSNDVNSQFAMSGRYGSGAHADVLSKNLANADQSVLYNDYMQQQARMDQASQQAQAGNMGNAGMLQAGLGMGAQLPYTGSNNLANSLGALFNGGNSHSTSTSTQSTDPFSSILGAGASIGSAAIMASDERLKTNIELVHRDPDGLGWYNFNWRADPTGPKEYGVMAQEVEKIRPQAFVKGFVNGVYHGVNYANLKAA